MRMLVWLVTKGDDGYMNGYKFIVRSFVRVLLDFLSTMRACVG
jgi:hypothetical protein